MSQYCRILQNYKENSKTELNYIYINRLQYIIPKQQNKFYNTYYILYTCKTKYTYL